jgi:UDP-3-O-[3-hydroxymyristoyl] glucosamine N-acyltransferase
VNETRARTVGELAQVVKGRVYGDPETIIRGIASIEEARTGDITYAETPRFLEDAYLSSASAVLAPETPAGGSASTKVMIQVANPRLAFAQLLDLFAPEQYAERGIHATAVIGSDFRAGANVSIGAHCVLGENVRLGENVTIHPLAYIGDDVEIGDRTVIEPNVTLLRGTVVGANCILHAGTVLGADGFGYLPMNGKHRKVPQIGHVIIGNDVEIGSNVTIDRARTGATRVGSGTKIDNLVHIGHNCQIGENCIIVAQVGLAGGVDVGKNVVIAGQSGIKEQVRIGDNVVIGAQTGVMGDVASGSYVSGYGAKSHKETLRTAAAVNQLPDLFKKIREMERRLKQLEFAEPAAEELGA